MLLADSMAGARQVQTPIRSKSGTRKTACLDLTSGPQPLWRSGKHVVKSDLAPPAPYSLGTYIGLHVHMEPFSMYTWNLSPCTHGTFLHWHVNHTTTRFGLHMVCKMFTFFALGSAFRASQDERVNPNNNLWHASDVKNLVSGWIQ